MINKQNKKIALIKFFNIVFGSIGAFILIFSIIALNFFRPENPTSASPVITTISMVSELSGVTLPIRNNAIDNLPVKTTMIVYGLDNEGYGADAVMLVVLNRLEQTVKAINIPRDTLLTMNGSTTILRNHFGFAGRYRGPLVIKEHLEEMFNIDINYYIAVDLSAFRRIVDLIGPIYFNVPNRMLYNNFAVVSRGEVPFRADLWPGYQWIYGAEAEQIVRYRMYHDGDLSRIQNQQDFLSALVEQAVTSENIIRNLSGLLRIVYETIQTDIEFNDLSPFIMAFSNFRPENLHMYTLPVSFSPHHNNLDLVIPEARTLINYAFFSIPMPIPSTYNGSYNGEGNY